MDIVDPPLLWIDGRCYRLNRNRQLEDAELAGANANFAKTIDFSHEVEDDDDLCEMDESFVTKTGDCFTATIEIPSALCGLVIGKGGVNKKRLESDTRTKITFPGRDAEGLTKIVGQTKSKVLSARFRIEILAKKAREKQRPTHFISIPLTSAEIKENFEKFKSEILETCDQASRISPILFQEPEKMHLTTGVLVLLNENERQRAVQVLNRCGDIIKRNLQGNRLLIEICGIACMNDDPTEVNVLYGQVTCKEGPPSVLQHLADDLVDEFVKEELMVKQYDSVKLHATLMNTSFAKNAQVSTDSKIARTFNAKEIFEKFKNFRFGECDVPEIHLSQLHTKGPDGYYKDTCKVHVR
ncbi:activating signal cointegrator 1 complex subunit [Chamberlinius hualienensis]